MVSSQARREQVTLACARGVSKRRACELIEIARASLTYHSVRAQRDTPAIEAMKRLAAQYPRYGYRRIRVFLRREGHGMSRRRAHRLWRGAGLQLPRRRPRRRVATSRPRPLPATAPNLAHKDVRLCLDEAEALGVPMIVGSAVRQLLAVTN